MAITKILLGWRIFFSVFRNTSSQLKKIYCPAYYASMLILKYIHSVITGQTVYISVPEWILKREIEKEENEIGPMI